jgi:uncharacterized protein YndB with AHSA1/START domain
MMETTRFKMDLRASRDTVWKTFTSSESLSGWLCQKAEVEPFLGGMYNLFFERHSVAGRVFSIDRPRLLHVGAKDSQNPFEITIELFPTLDGTRLEVTQSFSADEPNQPVESPSIERIWMSALERLRILLAAECRNDN